MRQQVPQISLEHPLPTTVEIGSGDDRCVVAGLDASEQPDVALHCLDDVVHLPAKGLFGQAEREAFHGFYGHVRR